MPYPIKGEQRNTGRTWFKKGQVAWNKVDKIKVVCKFCKKEFEVHPCRKDTAEYCSRRCIGKSRSGSKSPQWRGGITSANKLARDCEEYRIWRKAVFKRDNWTCQKCKQRGGNLEAHHIKKFIKYPKLRYKLSNGMTLCKECHRLTKLKTIIDAD